MLNPPQAFQRYRELQRYVNWNPEDSVYIKQAYQLVVAHFPDFISDFYAEIERHPLAAKVITGGTAQIERLKTTLLKWLEELFNGTYDEAYVIRRMNVGKRHVEIGLAQVFANAAYGRLRFQLVRVLCENWKESPEKLLPVLSAMQKQLDLDLALIVDAYEAEHLRRQKDAERLRFEGELHQEREFNAGLLSHAPVMVVVLDAQGRYVRGNPFFLNVVGDVAQSFSGHDWIESVFAPHERDRLHSAFFSAESAAATTEISSTLLSREGQLRHIRWAVARLRDPAGATFAHLVIGHDVTELQRAQERALQAERLAAIGQMATGLAHESRNALQRIQACAEMLELEMEGNTEALDLVSRIQNAQGHIGQLLEEVRGYAAPVKLDRSWCRLSDIWREAWDTLSPQRKGRSARLCEEVCDTELRALVDRFRLAQVFRNLFENSLAATADPVEITVTVNITGPENNDKIFVRVADNGPGMKPEEHRRAFEPFFTTKPKGTGLGMAIAQRIVEAHGGTIQIIERPPPGAEILIQFPRGVV